LSITLLKYITLNNLFQDHMHLRIDYVRAKEDLSQSCR